MSFVFLQQNFEHPSSWLPICPLSSVSTLAAGRPLTGEVSGRITGSRLQWPQWPLWASAESSFLPLCHQHGCAIVWPGPLGLRHGQPPASLYPRRTA